ncbi:RNA-binding domain-containing protein [Hortaea werneckii]|nr:RNA-binding domain-containing protein [Hortaea werneckii]KAI7095611.1 RNA-binding domain-containing protein [Hortaea werneckii]KAI7316453.1 RNA-binding domain-containing protein [Hortaea werneckii]KAI7393561.1 RNA-binding domain-containing protein [Hortaea werneckii]
MAPKKKQEKMNLGAFLNDQSLGSWADEMDAQPLPPPPSTFGARDRDAPRREYAAPAWENARSGAGMGAAGASFERQGYAVREQLPLPDKPPYTAHLGNLAYDITQVDIEGFLSDCQVTNVRIVEDKLDRKPKGFGYVEFATLDGLKTALTKTETPFMGRNIKISVAEPPKERAEPSRDFSDWSRKGPLPDLPSQGRQPSRGFNRGGGFDNMSDVDSERGGSRRGGFFEGDGKQRDFGNWERKGPLSPTQGAPPMREGGRAREGEPTSERRRSPAWGEGRSDAGSRPPRPVAAERVPTAAETDNQWRARMKPDQPSPAATPEVSAPTSPAAPEGPKERPRLNLAKRTVSAANPDAPPAPAEASSKASPFGAARPVDSAARERAVEEKRQIAIREKAVADEKAKEEKAKADAEARASRGERADKGQADQEKITSPSGRAPREPRGDRRTSRQQNGPRGGQQKKENGEEQQQKERPNFSILQRDAEDAAGEEELAGQPDAPDANLNGEIVGDKEVKPQEIVKEVSADGNAKADEPTAEAMEDEGWSTVAAKTKGGRRGGQRAMAS